MIRKIPRLVWLSVPMAYLLYFYRLGAVGMLGPDEPRYASIAREMARSGDWITPRLWGQPWFEKPALLYWMTGSGFRLGLGPDLAPRLPVAAMAVAFLVFYWWILRREFGCRAAWFSTLILGTSVEWLVSAQVAVPDLPLAATFSAAMLLTLPWLAKNDARWLPAAGALLGAAALAKGLVPLALAAPLALWTWRRRPGHWIRLAVPFLAVALPWYLLCYWKNGPAFASEFFGKQHFQRLTSNALLHVEPWWFYGKILLVALLPWTPLAVAAARPDLYRDRRRAFLLALVGWGILMFSVAPNKLPGYLLPLLPAAAALIGTALDEVPWRSGRTAALLAACAALLIAFPASGPLLPAAIGSGLSRAPRPPFQAIWLLPLAAVAAVWWLAALPGPKAAARTLAAVACIAAGATAGVVYLKLTAMPQVDRLATSEQLWNEIAARADRVCVESLHRNWRYPLNYYSGTPLPDCSAVPRPIHIRQSPGEAPGTVTVDPLVSGIVISPFQVRNP
jgi:4-amino-4-deoxy-L-arabinose transferase-like glycosyltransferase